MDPRTAELLEQNRRKVAPTPAPKPHGAGANARAWFAKYRLVASLTLGLSVLLFGGAYRAYIAKPAEMRAKTESESRAVEKMKSENATRTAAMEDCLSAAEADARARWNAACRERGQRAGCALPAAPADRLQQAEGTARNACLLRLSVAGQ